MTSVGNTSIRATDGVTLAYEDAGWAERGTVVLLHSLGADRRMWDACRESFERHHRVIAVDCRGHGASGPGIVASVDQWVGDLREILLAANASEVFLVGISLGGIQALAFAAAYPDMVAGLVVADSFVVLPPDVAQEKIRYLCDQVDSQPMASVADQYVVETFIQPYSAGAETVRRAIAAMDSASYAAAVEVCFGVRIEDRLSQITAPTLVIWGEHDTKAPRGLSEQIVNGIENARLVVLPVSGHLANVDNPVGFATEVTRFTQNLKSELTRRWAEKGNQA